MKKIVNKSFFWFVLVILVSLIPTFDLLRAGFPETHDGRDHVIRIANFYQNLTEGNIIPRWSDNLNRGYGHPILMFFYPLPYYSASLFHFLGFSFIDSTKLVFWLAYILSGVTMFLFVKKIKGNFAGFFAAMLYQFAPYRFIDFYVRGAIGEHVAFIFPPLVFLFLYTFYKTQKPYAIVFAAFSLAGLILSHNAISLMFLPLIILYIGFIIWQSKHKKIIVIGSLGIFVLGFTLSAFFWLPALLEGRYTLRNIVTAGEYAKRFVDPTALIYGQWNYGGQGQFTVQIGIVQLLILSVVPFVFLKIVRKKLSLAVITLALFLYTLLAIFLMTSPSQIIWSKIMLLQNFQFPWRFLSVVVFTAAMLGGIFAATLPRKIIVWIGMILSLGVFVSCSSYWYAKSYFKEPDSYFSKVQRTTTNDTGESSPIWSVRFMESNPLAYTEVIEGLGSITYGKRNMKIHEFFVEAKDKVRIRENTLYFPGWKIFANGKEITAIQFQDPKNRGLMTFNLPSGRHDIKVIFTDTKLRKLANTLTLISLVIIGIYSIVTLLGLWRPFR